MQATLLYRASCRRCRLLSRLSVIVAAGMLRRLPLDSTGAEQLYQRYPLSRGKLALIDGERVSCGLRVVPAGMRVALRGWALWLRRRGRIKAAAERGPSPAGGVRGPAGGP